MDLETHLIYWLIEFVIFVCLQSIAINGIFESFKKGNVLYEIAPGFFERNKNKFWSKPLFSCIMCMSSVYGGITFWGTVLFFIGFDYREIFVFVFDVFILVYVNLFFYKKL